MSITTHNDTATIIQFPQRPRIRLANGMTAADQPVARGEGAAYPHVVDQCWYHADAIHEDPDPSGKPGRPKLC